MNGLRILVLAPECNPDGLTNPSIGYHQAEALAQMHAVTLVIHAENEGAVRRASGSFLTIEPIRVPFLDRLYDWALSRIFRHDYGRQSLTAFSYPRHIAFEYLAWRRLRGQIRSREFDVVLRILPFNRVFPSPFAWLLRKEPIPFVIGPILGGLPWAKGFAQLDQQRRQPGYWLWNLRGISRFVPFARSTYTNAAAIVVGSSHTFNELERFAERLFFMPTEIGVNLSVFDLLPVHRRSAKGRLELIFVGRLIPLKGCDIALRGAAELLRSGAAHLTIVGDGPQRDALRQLAEALEVGSAVTFAGWLPHREVLQALQQADVMVFPSLREIGGGVVFEALAVGAVPVVAAFGGPGDVVRPDVGYSIPMLSEEQMVSDVQSALDELARNPEHLANLRRQGMAYVREKLTYEARARALTDIVLWVMGRTPKPTLEPPNRLHPTSARP
jgi:glycosyltransferase involved in cell wall biosynthesis